MTTRELEAGSVGVLVPPILDRHASGSVLAVFERSFYLKAGSEVIAIGDASLHDGPLNIRLRERDSRAAVTAELGIVQGQRWVIGRQRLECEDGPVIDLDTASTWQPARLPGRIDRDRLAKGLDDLQRRLAEMQLPEGSLIRLFLDGSTPENPTERAAAPYLQPLLRTLSSGSSRSPTISTAPGIDLLGLGPGLTPAGDDLLAGVLITCHELGESSVARRLGDTLLDAGPTRTTDISLAHLRAAAAGYGAAPLHDLLGAILRNDRRRLDQALDAAAKIGHSSGFDALGGIILTLRAWLEAGQLRRSSD